MQLLERGVVGMRRVEVEEVDRLVGVVIDLFTAGAVKIRCSQRTTMVGATIDLV